jgi:hypothetical protein
MTDALPIDFILSTLNAMDVGTLESVRDKLRQVEDALRALGQDELAARAAETAVALTSGNVAEFKRGRAYLQAKTGHLRRSSN